MFLVRLSPSTACIVHHLKSSSACGIPLTHQFCNLKTESFVERKKIGERSVIGRRNTGAKNSIVERKNSDGKNRMVGRASVAGGRGGVENEKQQKGSSSFVRNNKGVGHTLTAVAEVTGSNLFDDTEIGEDMEELAEGFGGERHFFDAAEDFDKVKSEEVGQRRKLAYQITKRKFFKSPVEPNLLTYAEKQHIRFLHEDEHQKWAVESLAESYPATPEIIKKVIKAKWKPRSAEDIVRHDKTVQRNWQVLKEGNLEIFDQTLREHLKRFPDRRIKIPSLAEAEKYIKKPEKKSRRVNEFLQIIEDYQALNLPGVSENTSVMGKSIIQDTQDQTSKSESAVKCHSKQSVPESEDKGDVGLIEEAAPTRRRAKHFTFEKFRETLEIDSQWEKKIDSTDRQIISSNTRSKSRDFDSAEEIHNNDAVSLSISIANRNDSNATSVKTKDKNAKNEVSSVKKAGNKLVPVFYDSDLADELKIAEYIKIPRHLKKEGCLYKVKDCFYAHDGEFLYRVPGLKK